jgi:cell filamentation protein
MKDPYVYKNGVLINKFDIDDSEKLKEMEVKIVAWKFLKLEEQDFGKNDTEALKKIHRYLFGDIYSWAGEFRTIPIEKSEAILGGDTIRYSMPKDIEKNIKNILKRMNTTNWKELSIEDKVKVFAKDIAELWQTHAFRDGNTRTIVTFADKFSRNNGFELDLTIIKENSTHFRNYLVKASDGQYADIGYLERMLKACIESGEEKKKVLNKKSVSNNKIRSRSRINNRENSR